MSKPISRPEELGRAIGYNVDVGLVLEKLKDQPKQWDHLKTSGAFLSQVAQTAALQRGNATQKPKRFWAVVKIERGIPVMIDAYPDKRSAKKRGQFLRLHMRPESEQVELLEIKMPSD